MQLLDGRQAVAHRGVAGRHSRHDPAGPGEVDDGPRRGRDRDPVDDRDVDTARDGMPDDVAVRPATTGGLPHDVHAAVVAADDR